MLKDRTLVCLSISPFETPLPTSAHCLMAEFARNNRVLFVERSLSWKDLVAVRREGPMIDRISRTVGRNPRLWLHGEICVLTPPPLIPINALPEGGLYAAATQANGAVLRASVLSALAQMDVRADVLWVGFDLPAGAALAGTLGETVCAYHCFDEVRGWPYLARHGPALERKLSKRADVVFATSPALARGKRHLGVPVVYLPNGVDHDRFARALAPEVRPPRCLQGLPRPILAYVGNLEERVDYRLLERIAMTFSHGSLVLIGPSEGPEREQVRILETLPNVSYLGPVGPDDLPAHLKAIDVGLIPFRKTVATRHIYPLKANEYLAVGKPVVATDFADLGDLCPPVRVASGADAFCFAIRAALAEDSPGAALARSRFAAQNSWRHRAEHASAVLEGLLETRSRLETLVRRP